MGKKKQDNDILDERIKYYADKFEDIEQIYSECLENSKKYFKVLDARIDKLAEYGPEVRGSGKQLTDLMENAQTLLGQQKQLADGKYHIRSKTIDLALKDTDGDDGNETDMLGAIEKLLKMEEEKANNAKVELEEFADEEDLDEEIKKILAEGN